MSCSRQANFYVMANFVVQRYSNSPSSTLQILMVKQPQRSMRKHHLMLIRSFDTLIIHHTPTSRSQIPYPAFPRPMDIIGEREESITRTTHPVQLTGPFRPLLCGQWRRDGIELTFPLCFLTTFKRFATHEQINRVRFFGAFNAFFERERENTRVMAEPPVVGFGAC